VRIRATKQMHKIEQWEWSENNSGNKANNQQQLHNSADGPKYRARKELGQENDMGTRKMCEPEPWSRCTKYRRTIEWRSSNQSKNGPSSVCNYNSWPEKWGSFRCTVQHGRNKFFWGIVK
jgi:hypothetical protein